MWLRWYDVKGDWILTEAEFERQRAEQESQRAEQESQRAEQAENQLQSLLQKLRESGIDPNTFLNS